METGAQRRVSQSGVYAFFFCSDQDEEKALQPMKGEPQFSPHRLLLKSFEKANQY